tara:strand:- start:2560 stop:4431 length:1872 start_codon:yes stop_codon:yes gene_type:complete
MPIQKLRYKPGVNRDVTSFTNEGGWIDSEKVRFRLGFPEKIGGWVKYTLNTFLGSARTLFPWTALDGSKYIAVGSSVKYYIVQGDDFNDITPIRQTTTGEATFSAANGATVATVTDGSHGVNSGDFVTFSDAASLGGNVTAAVLNKEYEIISVPTVNTFTINLSVTANGSDTGNGGGSTVAAYQIDCGLDTQVGGTGWGAGTWQRGTWGSAFGTGVSTELALWNQDNYGEDLLLNIRDGAIFYWRKAGGLAARAINLVDISGANNAPTVAKQVMVSDNSRHVIAFGTNTFGTFVQDPLLVRFSSSESLTDWAPSPTNSAGDLRIGSGSTFVTAIETKREIVIFTDSTLHSMQYIGAPFSFGIQPLSTGITIMGPNAAVAVEDAVFWMGQDSFYLYEGGTQQLPCMVKDKVFFDFNYSQKNKVYAAHNAEFSEVTWYYCSDTNSVANSGTGQNNLYVTYNYAEKVWYYGTLGRSAFIDRGTFQYPIGAEGGYLYNHEVGYDDDGSAMTASIEASPIDMGEGERFVFISKIIPDITFQGSTGNSPSVAMTLSMQDYPGSPYGQAESETVTSSAISTTTVPFEQFTTKADIRLRGRSFAFKIGSTALGVRWRLGSPRIHLRQDGRR